MLVSPVIRRTLKEVHEGCTEDAEGNVVIGGIPCLIKILGYPKSIDFSWELLNEEIKGTKPLQGALKKKPKPQTELVPQFSKSASPCFSRKKTVAVEKEFPYAEDGYNHVVHYAPIDLNSLPRREQIVALYGSAKGKLAYDQASSVWKKKLLRNLPEGPMLGTEYLGRLTTFIKKSSAFRNLDDIIIYSADLESHAERLGQVLDLLDRANLKLNLAKCSFCQAELRYLGHLVSEAGVRPDPGKIDAIRGFPRPTNVRGLRGFLGLSGYYRRFIDHYATIALPLTALLRKEHGFEWDEPQQRAFDTLKDALTSEAVLIYPNFAEPFILATDASGQAVGAVLSQLRDGHERPVAYISRQLSQAERNYSATERELLAAVWAIRQFRCYLLGRSFTLITDHAALRWLLSLKDLSSRLTRWALR